MGGVLVLSKQGEGAHPLPNAAGVLLHLARQRVKVPSFPISQGEGGKSNLRMESLGKRIAGEKGGRGRIAPRRSKYMNRDVEQGGRR